MRVICLDLEGVLIPEIWIALARRTGIAELAKTTRDEPDYNRLMRFRLDLLAERRLGFNDIVPILEQIEPLDGALEFVDQLRDANQVIILSDTFTQFGIPIMRQFGRPTLFCNELVVAENGRIVDWRLRQPDGKRTAVEALRSIGLQVFAAGDSYNDISMIVAAERGALFCPPEAISAQYPHLPQFRHYDPLRNFLLAD